MNTLAPSFLNQSSSFLQVTRTCMKAWMRSNFSQIPPPTELSALGHLKNQCIMFEHSSSFSFDRIFFVFAGKEDNHKILDEFKFRPALTKDCGVSCP